MPGDDPKATSFFSNVSNGNGNGYIDPIGTDYFCNFGTESCMVWAELYQAGFWSFNADRTTAQPTAAQQCGPGVRYPCFMKRPNVGYVIEAIADSTGFAPIGATNHISIISDSRAGTSTWFGGNYIYGYQAISANESQEYDSKIDDGKPLTGKIVARANVHPVYRSLLAAPAGGRIGDACVATSGGAAVYASATTIDCVLTMDIP